MARLNTDGSVDQSFQGSGWYYHLLVQPDGKILAWTDFALDRFNADGSLDTSFQVGQRISNDPYQHYADNGLFASVFLQPDGKLIVAGGFHYVLSSSGDPGAQRMGLVRFNPNGSLDQTFVPVPQAVSTFGGLTCVGADMQKNGVNAGKILYLWGYTGAPAIAFFVGRLNPDGSFDSSFQQPPNGGDGWYVPSLLPGSGLFAESDDRVLLFGAGMPFTGYTQNIVRLDPNGALDTGFNAEVFSEFNERGTVQSILQQPDGRLIAVGQFHSLGNASAQTIARLETNGARDPTFDSTGAGPAGENVLSAVIRPSDGKIFVAGYFATFGGANRNNFAWLNPDGSLNAMLNGTSCATNGLAEIYALATQDNGKILAGGYFTSVNGTPHSNLVRLNADGTLDNSFGVSLGTVGNVKAIKVLPNGKILIGGFFRAIDGVGRGRLARLQRMERSTRRLTRTSARTARSMRWRSMQREISSLAEISKPSVLLTSTASRSSTLMECSTQTSHRIIRMASSARLLRRPPLRG